MRARKVFVFLLLVVLGCLLVLAKSPTTTTPEPIAAAPERVAGTYCYARSQRATSDAPYAVEEQVQITIAGNTVTGEKSGTQTGPDMTNGYTGTLIGSIAGSALELTYSYTIEGSHNREREIYSLAGDTLIKKRWTLHDVVEDGERILVPDRSGEPEQLVYTAVPCAVALAPAIPPATQGTGKCYVGGCSGQICSAEPDSLSDCQFKQEYTCYETAKCERQSTGACGWTPTPELKACISGNSF